MSDIENNYLGLSRWAELLEVMNWGYVTYKFPLRLKLPILEVIL